MIIGLSVNHKDGTSRIADAYVNAVIKAGGTPVLIPLINNPSILDKILSKIDGLILSGGGDIYTPLFNEELHPTVTEYDLERDQYDIQLARLAEEKQIPILGICRGMQVLNVTFGGNLIQDIPSEISESPINHNQSETREIGTHSVSILPESRLYSIIKEENILVNSFHHQSVKEVAPGFEAVAFAEDGIIEAMESSEEKAILGVQWHPENMAVAGNQAMIDTFKYLTDEAALYEKAKAIHKRICTIDSHCDTPMYFPYGIDIGKKNSKIRVNLYRMGVMNEGEFADYELKVDVIKMQEGMLDGIFMVAYLRQGNRDEKSSEKTTEKAISILNEIKSQAEKNRDIVALAYTSDDLKKNKSEFKKSIFMGIENGYAIGKDLKNLTLFKEMGVTYITLTHNGDNDIADSAIGKNEHKGLSDFGEEVVREMNRLGMIIDISHASEKTSFDVLEISEHPIIASHSSTKALCNHPRNISDKLMKAIAEKRGVIQICLYGPFLKKGGNATVKDAVDHIDHIVKTVGIDHVGIGSDFDGGGGVKGLQKVNEYPQLTIELLRRGYSEEEIAKIWGENLMRVMNIVQNKSF